jgi:hypothetical protein
VIQTLAWHSVAVLCGLIGECVHFVRLLLILGSFIISSARFFLGAALLALRCGRSSSSSGVGLGLLTAALHWRLSCGRRSSLALGSTCTFGRLGGHCCRGGGLLFLGGARALGGWTTRRRVVFIFDIELQGLVDCGGMMMVRENEVIGKVWVY